MRFYVTTWKPWAEAKHLPTTPNLWRLWLPDNYDVWIGLDLDKNDLPWSSLGKYYDETILPYLKKTGKR